MGRDRPMIPEAAPGGRPPGVPKCEIVEAILYLLLQNLKKQIIYGF
jgi:hypothetical protein